MNNKTRFSALALAVVMMLSLLSAYPAFMAVTASTVYSQDFLPDANCGDTSAKLNITAPSQVNVGEEFELVITWSDITYTEDVSELPASMDVYFNIDTRYIAYVGFVGIDGLDSSVVENMCSGPKEGDDYGTDYMQPLQVALAIKDADSRALVEREVVARVTLKAVAVGTTDPAAWTYCALGSGPSGAGYTVVADVDNANEAAFGWTVEVVDPSAASEVESSTATVPVADYVQEFLPDANCGDTSAKLTITAPAQVNVGEEFELEIKWSDITYTEDVSELPASMDVYFNIDTRYIAYVGFVGIDGLDSSVVENMCSGPKEGDDYGTDYMQPLQVALAIKDADSRALVEREVIARVTLKAVAVGTTDPAEWTYCALGSGPSGAGYTVIADVDNANEAAFGWTVEVVDPSSVSTEESSEESSAVVVEDFNQDFLPDANCGDTSAKLNITAPSQVNVGEEFELVITWSDITYTEDVSELPASMDVYFNIDTRYIAYVGFVGIDGLDSSVVENMCSGPKEGDDYGTDYMQPLQVALAIKDADSRALVEREVIARVTLKAVAVGTTDPAEWTYCALGSGPSGAGYTVVADVDNANNAVFGWTVNVVGEGSEDSSEEPAPNEYTVTFVGMDGAVIDTQTVTEGGAATAPEAPAVDGYDFTGWDVAFDNVTSNLTVTAVYTIKTVTVTFVAAEGGSIVGETTVVVDYGTDISTVAYPEATANEGYSFTGWDKVSGVVTSDTTITAEFAQKEYDVVFVDREGNTIKSETVVHGGAATAPEAPVVEGYDFTGWDVAFDNVTSHTVVTAVYAIKTFTVTFQDKDGNTIDTQTVEWGQAAVAPEAPVVEGETFSGWSADFSSVKSDLTVKALYGTNSYTVTFVVDGETVDTQTVNHGAAATAPADPTKEGYDFAGWDVAYDNITANTTVTATWTIKTYTVTFVANGETVDTQTINWGEAAADVDAPAVEGYDFVEWDTDYSVVKSDLTVTAVYAIKSYTVTFVVGAQGTTDDQLVWTVDYGTASSAITVPTVTASGAAYAFTGWDKELPATITEDITITAQFETTGSAVNVTFVGGANGTLIGKDDAGNTVVLAAGETLTIAVPSGEQAGASFVCPDEIADENYSFAGWYLGDELYDFSSIVEGDITLTAKFVKNSITIDSFSMDAVGTMGYANAYLYVTLNDGVVPENVQMVTFYQTEDGRTNITIDNLDISQDASGNYYIQMAVAPGSYTSFDVYLIDGVIDFSSSDWNVIDVYTGQVIA